MKLTKRTPFWTDFNGQTPRNGPHVITQLRQQTECLDMYCWIVIFEQWKWPNGPDFDPFLLTTNRDLSCLKGQPTLSYIYTCGVCTKKVRGIKKNAFFDRFFPKFGSLWALKRTCKNDKKLKKLSIFDQKLSYGEAFLMGIFGNRWFSKSGTFC